MARPVKNKSAEGTSAKQECRELIYSGDVQGVGFRATTYRVALALDVTGWVMNLPDGGVKLVAEGSPQELDRLEQGIHDRMSGHITDIARDTRPATGQFRSFEIRY